MPTTINLPFHLILPAMGLIFLVFGVKKLLTIYTFAKKALRTQATVINFANTGHTTRNDDGEEYAITCPIIRYTTQTGEEIVRTDMGGHAQEIGDQMTIYYDPNQPNSFQHLNFSTLGLPVIAGVLGLIFLLYAAFTF